MPLVVTSVPNLAQGVSQQPDNLRYPGQCDEQINAWSTVVEGLVKRPNTRWVKEFNSSSVTEPNQSKLFTHFVKRDEDNKYCVTVSLGNTVSIGQVSVIDLETGDKVSVATTSIANSYLTGISNPLADLRALTVADYTFLVNTKKTIAKDTTVESKSQTPPDEALIFVKLGDYEKTYDIYIDDGLVPHTSGLNSNKTPSSIHSYESGTSSSTGLHADTSIIAEDLKTIIETEFDGTGIGVDGVDVVLGGSGYEFPVNDHFNIDAYKVEIEVSQAGITSTALGKASITNGVITGVEMIRYGSGFNPSNPYTFVVTEKLLLNSLGHASDQGWINLSQTAMANDGGSGATFTVSSTITRTALDVSQQESIVRIKSNDGRIKIRTADGLGNEGLQLIYREVDSITDLPKVCYNNFKVKVKGDADIDQDDYFVRFSTKEKGEFGEGSWVETVGWYHDGSETGSNEVAGIETALDFTTMPVTLVPVFSGSTITSFKLQYPQQDEAGLLNKANSTGWRVRTAGDDDTNPFPSFVGKTINDVFFFKNRLGFLTDSTIVFSEADEYFNFFRTTNQQLLDSAPIDVGLSHTKVAVLQYALPFQEKLMLFSKQSQFVLRGADVLSPKTVAISPVTEYDISDGIAPLALGSYIYFPFNRGQYEGMFEYFVDNNTEVFEAEEITSQIPKYIPSKLRAMAGSASESMVLLQNATDLKTLYVYKYFWSGKEKIQSAWQKWTFNDNVTGFDFIDSTLYLILNSQQLVQMPVENALTDEGLDYTLLLDNRVDGSVPSVSYDDQTNRTTISNLPDGYGATVDNMTVFTKGGSERNVVASSSGTSIEIEGFLASYVTYSGTIYKCTETHTSSSSNTPGVSSKWSASTDVPSAPTWSDAGVLYNKDDYFVVGKPYNMLYRFSNQALKQPTERGGRSASDYTYQTIRNASIEYADTGHFTVEVTPRFRDKYTYVYNPALLSSISTLDRFTPESGHFRFGVQCRPKEATIEVKSSSALPVKLLAAEFESMVTGRSKRYGA